jgi:hypothetical protein
MADEVVLSRDNLYDVFTREYSQAVRSWESQMATDVNRSKITINDVKIEQSAFSPTDDPLTHFNRRLNQIPEWEDLSEALYDPLCLIASQTILAEGITFLYNRVHPNGFHLKQTKIRRYSTNTVVSNATNTSSNTANSSRSIECAGNCININIDSTGVYLFRSVPIEFVTVDGLEEPSLLKLKLNMACKLQLSREQPYTGSLHYFIDLSDFAEELRAECLRKVGPIGSEINILKDSLLELLELSGDYPFNSEIGQLKDKLRLYFSLKDEAIPQPPRRNRTTVSHFRNSRLTRSSRVLNSARVSRVLNSSQIAKRGGRRSRRKRVKSNVFK